MKGEGNHLLRREAEDFIADFQLHAHTLYIYKDCEGNVDK